MSEKLLGEQVIPFLHESAFRDFSLHGFRGWMECSRLLCRRAEVTILQMRRVSWDFSVFGGTLASVDVWWAHTLNIGIGGLIPDDLQL